MDTEISGLGLAPSEEERLALAMGDAPSALRWPSRDIAITSVITKSAASREGLRKAMTAGPLTEPLTFMEFDHDAARFFYARPQRMETTGSRSQFRTRGYVYDLLWTAYDPRTYSVVAHETTVSASNPLVPNDGVKPAPWVLEVEGPCTSPRLRNLDNDTGAWRWDGLTLTSGQTLVVDTRVRTAYVLEDGEDPVDVWAMAQTDSGGVPMLFGIQPGGTHVGFARASGASSALLRSHDAW